MPAYDLAAPAAAPLRAIMLRLARMTLAQSVPSPVRAPGNSLPTPPRPGVVAAWTSNAAHVLRLATHAADAELLLAFCAAALEVSAMPRTRE